MPDSDIRPELLDVLACPACDDRPKVELKNGAICCSKCGRTYPIEDGIPIMLIEKATIVSSEGESL